MSISGLGGTRLRDAEVEFDIALPGRLGGTNLTRGASSESSLSLDESSLVSALGAGFLPATSVNAKGETQEILAKALARSEDKATDPGRPLWQQPASTHVSLQRSA